jgi:DNA polymerase
MKESISQELWEILDMVEDHLEGGFRRNRPGPPRAVRTGGSAAARGSTAAEGSHGVAGSEHGHAGARGGYGQGSAAAARTHGGAQGTGAAATPTAQREGPDAWYAPRVPEQLRVQLGLPEVRRSLTSEERQQALEQVAERVRSCMLCPLHEGRTNGVPGMGALDPLTMVIGEGPGADEDSQGLPFVGRAGQYLDKWLNAIALSRRSNAYIANIVKCRPPNNRDPQTHEADACSPYLETQIALVRPRTILAVGRISSAILTGKQAGIGKLRGRQYSYRGIPMIVTYHPSAVLRNEELKRPVWEDLKQLRALFPHFSESK